MFSDSLVRPNYMSTVVHSGLRSVRLGIDPTARDSAQEKEGYSSVCQSIQIPIEASIAQLRWWNYYQTEESQTDNPKPGEDKQQVVLLSPDLSTVAVLSNVRRNNDVWSESLVDLTPYRGNSFLLCFNVYNDGNGQRTWQYLDDVALNSCYPLGLATPTPLPPTSKAGAILTPDIATSTSYTANTSSEVISESLMVSTTTPNAVRAVTSVAKSSAAMTMTPLLGATWINSIDGAEYVYVPGGPFLMGANEDDPVAAAMEKPMTTTITGDYWIMRTEVTNREYKKCVEASACTEPANDRWNEPEYSDHPVTDVTWLQAHDYATWSGGHLPTEAQWEKACRGPEGHVYPWGNSEPTSDLANYNSTVGDTTPVQSYSPKGDSLYGLADMAGNAWEWTSSQYLDYPYDAKDGREDPDEDADRALRGGGYVPDAAYVRCTSRGNYTPHRRANDVGFRLVFYGN